MKLSEMFEHGLPTKPRRSRSLLTAAELMRRLQDFNLPREPYEVRSIWISGIGKMDISKWLLDYWSPSPQAEDWKRRCYTEVGNTVHRILQEHWHNAGVLVPEGGEFKEQRVFCPNFGFSGKLDAIFNAKKILNKDIPNVHGEIKVTNSYYYGEWQHPETLPEDYRFQATVYQKLLGVDKTCFVLVNRDSFDLRTVFYRGEDDLWERAKTLARECWKHVENRTFPGLWGLDTPFADWVEEKIASQPDREFAGFPCQ